MKMYWKYLKYIIEHKKNVFIEAWKMGLYFHAFTHDLSKFRPSEFFPYADKFFSGDYSDRYHCVEMRFAKAWNFHQKRNKHHWNYWVSVTHTLHSVTQKNEIIPLEMPEKYVKQMIADWKGMSRKFGDNTREYYEKNRDKMILHQKTIEKIENLL